MSQLLPQATRRISSNGINIYFEAFGNPKDPPVLLIMGLASQCLNWFPYFYEPIVERGYYVIRFDNRDIGLSSWIEHTQWQYSPYSLEEMAKDAVGLLKALNIESANLIGVSMGGMIAQRLAISHPSCVLSLTSLLSSAEAKPITSSLGNLPLEDSTEIPSLDMQLNLWRMLAGSRYPFEEALYRQLYREGFEVRQGYNPNCAQHHLEAIRLSGSRLDELSQITAPTLVVHGTEDPLIPVEFASDYAQKISGAKLLLLDGAGHEIPQVICSMVHQEIFNLFAKVQ